MEICSELAIHQKEVAAARKDLAAAPVEALIWRICSG